ncbi:metal-dependent hydrolase family protein [Cysteiniphilum halobium]|uniref:metal-dependent hydrolase family protein n=1 Tax=Cysteiniphilum halobium TaxID=2219059 RepID=UPI001F27555A|nr:amidohydrolase family protein [Cysteiniphilum halobium]
MILLKNCQIIDKNYTSPSKPTDVYIKNERIEELGSNLDLKNQNLTTLDMSQYYIMPGLIDAHVHVTAARPNVSNTEVPIEEISIQAKKFMEDMIERGFTTIRDAGGASDGLAHTLAQGLIKGPRLFYSGKALSQTGGHGDFRKQSENFEPCFCHQSGSNISVVCDGVSAVQKVAREQLRKGASQIKIMASGGINSPTDRLDSCQFSFDEIKAIVDVAKDSGTYVMAHAYYPSAIKRCLEAGVRSIEHGNMLDEETAKLMKSKKAFLVPTLAIFKAMETLLKENKYLTEDLTNKLKIVQNSGVNAINIAKNHHVKIGFGTDLLGEIQHTQQLEGIALHEAAQTPYELLCSMTSINAELLNMENKIGEIKQHYLADIIAVKDNPLDGMGKCFNQKDNVVLVIKNGEILKINSNLLRKF